MAKHPRLKVCVLSMPLMLYNVMLPASVQAAKPAVMKLKFTSPLAPPPFLISETAKWWADEVAKRSGGRIEWEFFWMGALTKAGEELETIEIGLAQVGSIAAPYYAGKLPLSNWTYAVPFGPGDPTVILDATKQLYREVPELAAELGKYNQKLLIPLVIDTYNLTSKRPIVTFEDFKGVKIASIGAYHPKILSVARSSAIHMPVAERYTALQTGVIEAEFLPWDISFAYNPTTSFGSPSFTSLCLRAWTPILLGPPETSSGHCRTLIARPLRCCYPVADKGDGSVAVATMRTDGC